MAPPPDPQQPYRRRRLSALGGLVAVLVAIIAVVAVALGGGGDGGGSDSPLDPRPTTSANASTSTTATTPAGGPARDLGSSGPPRPVPILMYHVIAEPFADSPYPDLYVPKEEFADQMDALKRAGYTAVTLQEVWDSWHEDGPLPKRPVVVSLDDGYHSHLANALPVLRALGWPAVLNLELQNIRSDYGLTGPQVKELIAAGWEVDSHTLTHPDLTTVDAATLTREVADSRAELRRRFGVPVNFFCYPAGRYDETVIAAVQQAGYLAATTTNPGLAQPDEADAFELDRVRVNNGVTGAALVAQLDGLGAPS
jgi:peptidoglycan/xylan/chitin deacetylase (PgdA/CDA1 family)